MRSVFGGAEAIDALNPWLGDLLIMCSAVLLGLRQVYLSQLGQNITVVKMLTAQGIFGIATFLAGSLVFETEPIRITLVLAMSLIYQGVVIAGIAFLAQTWLLSNYLPSRVTLISLCGPVVTAALSWLILGEQIGPELWVWCRVGRGRFLHRSDQIVRHKNWRQNHMSNVPDRFKVGSSASVRRVIKPMRRFASSRL